MPTLISKESLLGKLEQLPPDQFYNIASIRNFIKAEEEAVVRCKDCKHFCKDDVATYCAPMGMEMQPNDYCSYAERKEE